jgi:threonyl-tRNA synthetase
VEGQSWRTTPYDVARGISQGLADNTVVAKVDGEVWDLDRPFEKSSTLQLLKFDDEEAQAVFWHSTAHVLGEAMERCYGGCLCYGPPIENGFYYDMFLQDRQVKRCFFVCVLFYRFYVLMFCFLGFQF